MSDSIPKKINRLIASYLTEMISAVTSSQTLLLVTLPILVGLGSGIGVWLFKLAYNFRQSFLFNTAGQWIASAGKWTMILIPAAGGLIVGLFNRFFFFFFVGFQSNQAVPYAIKPGVALQMTKILRDVREDRRNGRVYPPRDEMVFYGIRESDMAEGKVTSRWRQFMRFQIQRTRQIRKARKVNSTSGSSQKFNKPLITHWILNCSLRPME